MSNLIPLPSRKHSFGGETWQENRYRLDAEWSALTDEKNRRVHGYAVIGETPADMLGRELTQDRSHLRTGTRAFTVEIIATRDSYAFGAMPRVMSFATLEEAMAHARKALVQQGKRYAKKFGPETAAAQSARYANEAKECAAEDRAERHGEDDHYDDRAGRAANP
jgi:hypothetical protein